MGATLSADHPRMRTMWPGDCQRSRTLSRWRNGTDRQAARNRRESQQGVRGRRLASVRARMRTLVLVLVAGGCSYSPGSYSYFGKSFPGERVTVGCLDISVHRRADFDGKAVLDYQFGNRCDESVLVDLVRVPVVGRTVAGDEVTLAPFDPGLEMMALRLGARQAGGEAIAYPYPAQPLAQICSDVAAIYADATEKRWVCFASMYTPAPPTTIAEVTP
jgi:hypothetical protein